MNKKEIESKANYINHESREVLSTLFSILFLLAIAAVLLWS